MLHHFSAYDTLSDAMLEVSPALSNLLFGYGRMAVQVFLVVAGYLAAGSLARVQPSGHGGWWRVVWQRYVRLIGPLLLGLMAGMAVALVPGAVDHAGVSAAAGTAPATASSRLAGTFLSLGLGLVFHLVVEQPLGAWLGRKRTQSLPSGP